MELDEGFDLSKADVIKLLKDPSSTARADTASKVIHKFDTGALTPEARLIAMDIVRVMVRDTEVMVRSAVSHGLRKTADVPKDIALSLAKDVIEVSEPILEFSTILSDEDLISIIGDSSPEHQMAIARREVVSEAVSDALVETYNKDVVVTLVRNDRAMISEQTFHKVVDTFGDDTDTHGPLVHRSKLPLTVAERMVSWVSDKLKEYLVTHHELSSDVAAELVLDSRERATMALLTPESEKVDVHDLVDQLFKNGRLTASLILRALCTGDLLFFEAAVARMAQVPVPNAYILINDKGSTGFQRLYLKAGLPKLLFPVFRAAVDVAREMSYDGMPRDRDRFIASTIERVLTSFEAGEFEDDNVDYLVSKLNRIEATLDVAS
jgi:uncharacterized protein (DUF2336 family)